MNTEVFYRLILSFWVCIARHAQSTQNKFAYLCNISRKTWGFDFFCLQINTKVFDKLIVSLLFGFVEPGMLKGPKIMVLQYLYNISSGKREG